MQTETNAPSPSPFPLFSPWAGQLLSSLPMGEKRGKGEGDGAVLWLPTHWATQTAVSESKNLCSIQALFCQKSLFVRKPSHNIWLVVCGCVCITVSDHFRTFCEHFRTCRTFCATVRASPNSVRTFANISEHCRTCFNISQCVCSSVWISCSLLPCGGCIVCCGNVCV